MIAVLVKLICVGLFFTTNVLSGDVSIKEPSGIMTDEEAAAKCDWNISFILSPQTRRDICDIYCIMFYNGHDFPNENEAFPPKEEQFRECIQWSNVAGAPGICYEVHEMMRCVITKKYGPPQEEFGVKKTAFIPLIKELLNKQ